MRFRTRQKPRGLLNRRDQIRLTLLILALGVVIVSMNVARRPRFWSRVFPEQSAESLYGEPYGRAVLSAEIRTVLRPDFETGSLSEWLAATVPNDLLATIEDNVIGVGADEARAYLVTLRLAEKISSEAAAQLPPVHYALLMDSPAACRGKAWKVTGTLRRLSMESLSEDRFGVSRVVEAWLSLPDSGSRLVRVVALEKDPELREGVQPKENPPQVQLSGYFFKKQAYAASGGGLRIAPLLLADRISLIPEPEVTTVRSDQLTPWLGWLTVITCCSIGLVVVAFAVSDAGNRRLRIHELTQLPTTTSFDGVDVVSPAESLSALEIPGPEHGRRDAGQETG